MSNTFSRRLASLSPFRSSLARLLALLGPVRTKYVIGLIGRVGIATIERLYIAYVAKLSLDAMVSNNVALFNDSILQWILFYLGYLLVAPFIVYVWRSAIAEGTAHIREAVFSHLQRLPLGYHESHHSGESLSILTNDVTAAERAYQDDLMMLFEAVAQGFSAAVFMLWLNWQLTLLIVVSSLVPLIVNALFAGPLRRIGDAVQAALGQQSERMTDLLAGWAVVRSFNLGDWILERFETANDQVLERSVRRARIEAALAAGNEFGGFFSLVSMAIGSYFVLTGQTTIGVLIGLVQLSNQIAYFVYSIGGTLTRVQGALAAADRILKMLDEPAEPERLGAPGTPALAAPSANGDRTGGIAFEQVGFAYDSGADVLDSLSFAAAPGQVVAFAGPSGGGKSTIFKLLLGGYAARRGVIRVDGRSIDALRLTDLRDRMAYVPQDAYLFAGTIMDNIRFGKPTASDAEVEAAARAAFAHDFIVDFPNGYQTIIGERGTRLSGGQRQRISIARALLKDAPILLLDEATSALDSESEAIVQQALEVLMRGRTTLVIAHRLSTIQNADQIFVIEKGRVAESGNHRDLLAQRGLYANLFELQFRAKA